MQYSALERAPSKKDLDTEVIEHTVPSLGDADEAFVLQALEHANLNVLRMALYQQTRDPDLAAMKVVKFGRPGSPFMFSVVHKNHDEEIKKKALAYLMDRPLKIPPAPSKEETGKMMELFQGEELDATDKEFGWEDLALEGFPRQAEWRNKPSQEVIDKFKVTIIGAGFSGLVAAIQLEHLGIPYRIIERQAGLGGTWFLNDYPEARVDITSFLYQFKFEKSYPWKSHFATQGELLEYIDYIVDKYGLRDKIALNTALEDARWDEAKKQWVLQIKHPDGSQETIQSNAVMSCSGLFSTPRLPEIPGIEDYQGEMFHTTNWNHDYDLTGKNVAIIGTGSTGTQLTRNVAAKAGHLTIYQRTPNWVTAIPGYRNRVADEKRWLLDNMPGYASWFSYSHHVSQLQMQAFHQIDRDWQAKGGKINEKNDQLREGLTAYVRKKVGDRDDLFEKLIPDFAPISRRLVVDNGWYDSLLRDNVELEANGIKTFTKDGIISQDGTERKFDTVVLGAGFKVSQYLWPVQYVGRDGRQLQDLWGKDGARAHLTMTLPGFPNFFMLYGPNAGVRAGSFHTWVEIFSRYVCNLITETIESGSGSIEVKEEAYQNYNDMLDTEMSKMLWEEEKGGGGSYYVNEFGRSGVNMPWTLQNFFNLVKEPDVSEYQLD